MRPRLMSLVVLVACCGFLRADPPVITGGTEFPAYKMVRLSAGGLQKNDAPLWKVRPLDIANEGKVDFSDAGRSGGKLEFVAPPGRYRVELLVGRGTASKFSLEADEKVVTIGKGDVIPDPKPVDPVKPDPKPVDPVVPSGEADAALVAKVKPLVGGDAASVALLGGVYRDYAAFLDGVNDPNIRPKTVQQVVAQLTERSRAAKVPVLPALEAVRRTVAEYVGEYDAMAAVTDAVKAELIDKYRKVGASLLAASK